MPRSCQDSTVWTEVAARGRVRSADDGTRSHGPRRIPSSSSMTASIVHTGAVHIPPISSSGAFNYGCIKHTAYRIVFVHYKCVIS